jgi:hypothetical protein
LSWVKRVAMKVWEMGREAEGAERSHLPFEQSWMWRGP